jgi:hypothetical protein
LYFPSCEADASGLCTRRCSSDADCGASHLVCRDAACVPGTAARDPLNASFIECAGPKLALYALVQSAKACASDADCQLLTSNSGFSDCDTTLAVSRSADTAELSALAADVVANCAVKTVGAADRCSVMPLACRDGQCDVVYQTGRCDAFVGETARDPCVCDGCHGPQCDCVFFGTAGCWDLSMCIGRTGCVDRADCYRPETCMWFIDAAGGPFSPVTDAALRFANCCGADCAAQLEQ